MGTVNGTQKLADRQWIQVDGSRGLVLNAKQILPYEANPDYLALTLIIPKANGCSLTQMFDPLQTCPS